MKPGLPSFVVGMSLCRRDLDYTDPLDGGSELFHCQNSAGPGAGSVAQPLSGPVSRFDNGGFSPLSWQGLEVPLLCLSSSFAHPNQSQSGDDAN